MNTTIIDGVTYYLLPVTAVVEPMIPLVQAAVMVGLLIAGICIGYIIGLRNAHRKMEVKHG